MKVRSFWKSFLYEIGIWKPKPMQPLKPISEEEFASEVIFHLLGDDWYVVDPLSTDQILAIALDDIKRNYKKVK